MTGYNEISQSIAALRAESSPQSVTPERVGALLQAITDLINALRLVPDTDVADDPKCGIYRTSSEQYRTIGKRERQQQTHYSGVL